MKKVLLSIFAFTLIFSQSYAQHSKDSKEKDIRTKKEKEETECRDAKNMQKDYEELMSLYKTLKLKAEDFQRKYNMLPHELMPLIMRQNPGMEQNRGFDGKMQPPGEQQRFKEAKMMPPPNGKFERQNPEPKEKDIFE